MLISKGSLNHAVSKLGNRALAHPWSGKINDFCLQIELEFQSKLIFVDEQIKKLAKTSEQEREPRTDWQEVSTQLFTLHNPALAEKCCFTGNFSLLVSHGVNQVQNERDFCSMEIK